LRSDVESKHSRLETGGKIMYDVKSMKAEEFINHEEILATLEYAKANKNNRELIDNILVKAEQMKGISHREASVLLECDLEDVIKKIYQLAVKIKERFYGNRIVMFAPLYLSNYCVNGCVYCPYHYINKHITRKKLTQEEIKKEVIALQDMGHKRLALEAGEDPVNNPLEYILESIQTIYSIKHKNGAIRRVNVNIAATTVEDYKKLKDAGIGTYILFQETYHKENYELLHPTGPKHNYAYHTEAMDRAMEAGIDDVGLGVLYGLNMYRYDFAGILMHAEHLEAALGVGPHTISAPRIRPAEDIDPNSFKDAVSDEIFEKIVAILRIAVPYTGIIVSTRESQKCREKVLKLGVSQISGGSKTSVGGYAVPELPEESSAQFDVEDTRTLDEIVNWLLTLGHIPSFCTACYREGRTGDRFMSLVKSGQIANCCQPNALMTLKEYLEDYALPDTKSKGEALIANELGRIPNEKVLSIAKENLNQIAVGKRDFRF
jgi:2-iminoacetate synthase